MANKVARGDLQGLARVNCSKDLQVAQALAALESRLPDRERVRYTRLNIGYEKEKGE